MTYDFKSIESKWQKVWEEQNLYATQNGGERRSSMPCLSSHTPPAQAFTWATAGPTPPWTSLPGKSGWRGKNVLFPIGYDAFGLPTENYAIQNHIHPRIVTEQNIATFRGQLKAPGL